MAEIVVTLTVEEAEALIPWKGTGHSPTDWNRRLDRAEDAQSKIRAELRRARAEQPAEQGSML